MKLYVNWRTATKAIFKNRKRSLLTMFGITIGIASVITILSIGRGFERDTIKSLTNDESDDVKVEINFLPGNSLNSETLNYFNEMDISLISQVEEVKSVSYPQPNYSSIYKEIKVKDKKENKELSLVNDSKKEPLIGRQLTTYDNDVLNKVAMIDSATAKQLYETSKKALNRGIEIDGQVFQIIGIYQGSEPDNLFSLPETNIQLPKKTYLHYFSHNTEKNALIITLEQGITPANITTEVIKKLEEKGTMREFGDYHVFDTALLTDGIGQILSTITVFISAVAGISLFIAGVGVMNMMYISVSERTKEIGIRRALGATRNSIRMQFLLEGVTLTFSGGIAGYIIGISLAHLIGFLINISITIDFFTISLAICVSTGIGLIFSVIPASEAAKKDLIDILR